MKNYLLIIVYIFISIVTIVQSAAAQTIGSFLITRQTFLYKSDSISGKRYYISKKEAFDVVDIKYDKKKGYRYKIRYPYKSNKVNGTGYLIEGSQIKNNSGQQTISVFPKIPLTDDLLNYVIVDVGNYTLTGKSKKIERYPNIIWQEVNYKSRVPLELWLTDSSGVFRVSRSKEWLNSTYKKIKQLRLSKSDQKKILIGIIEQNYTKEKVLLTLGEPIKKSELSEKKEEWNYLDKKIVFEDGLVKQVL